MALMLYASSTVRIMFYPADILEAWLFCPANLLGMPRLGPNRVTRLVV